MGGRNNGIVWSIQVLSPVFINIFQINVHIIVKLHADLQCVAQNTLVLFWGKPVTCIISKFPPLASIGSPIKCLVHVINYGRWGSRKLLKGEPGWTCHLTSYYFSPLFPYNISFKLNTIYPMIFAHLFWRRWICENNPNLHKSSSLDPWDQARSWTENRVKTFKQFWELKKKTLITHVYKPRRFLSHGNMSCNFHAGEFNYDIST